MAVVSRAGEVTAGHRDERGNAPQDWDRLMEVRQDVLKSLEAARNEKTDRRATGGARSFGADGDLYPLLEQYAGELPGLFIVSQVDARGPARETVSVKVERAAGAKCERCWKYTTDVGPNAGVSDHLRRVRRARSKRF